MESEENTGKLNSNTGEIFRPPQAAEYLGISESKLAKLRMKANRADGPRFSKIAGCIIYRRANLDTWVDSNVVDSE